MTKTKESRQDKRDSGGQNGIRTRVAGPPRAFA